MEVYQDRSGLSGIYGYDIGQDYINVYFKKGSAYRYTYDSTGEDYVEQMKVLAQNGAGLNAFINENCKEDYES